VVVGSVGSGKSTLINRLCNLTCCRPQQALVLGGVARATVPARPVRSQIIKGMSFVGDHYTTTHLIDTPGLSDTPMRAEDGCELVRQQVKSNMTHVHRVVVMYNAGARCGAGGAGGAGAESTLAAEVETLKMLMRLFDYERCAQRFTFICSRADELDAASRADCVARMSRALGTESLRTDVWGESVELNLSSGFPPGRTHDKDGPALDQLMRAVLVPLSESECPLIATRRANELRRGAAMPVADRDAADHMRGGASHKTGRPAAVVAWGGAGAGAGPGAMGQADQTV